LPPSASRDDVVSAAGSKPNNPAYRSRRIIERRRDARGSRERSSARGQMQKLSAGKFHFEPPSCFTSFDHLVGEGEQPIWNFKSKRPRSLKVDHQLELFGLHEPQGRGLSPPFDSA